jgi:cell division protein FtsW
MAVAVNLIPVTGQPLPLISRGGTSTLITCAYFGLILSADRFGIGKKKPEARPGEEVDHDQEVSAGSNELPEINQNDSAEPKEEVIFEVHQA